MPSLKEDGSGIFGMGPEFNFLKDHFKENGVYILFQDCWYTYGYSMSSLCRKITLIKYKVEILSRKAGISHNGIET